MTGLSDEQRADYKLMAAVGKTTIQDPPTRIQNLNRFSARLQGIEAIRNELRTWDLRLTHTPETMKGRTFPPETILHGTGTASYKEDNADWGGMFRNYKLFGMVGCNKWGVIYPARKFWIVDLLD